MYVFNVLFIEKVTQLNALVLLYLRYLITIKDNVIKVVVDKSWLWWKL